MDINAMYSGFITSIASSVGSDLYQKSGRPAIRRAREKGVKLKQPFVTLDVVGIRDKAGVITRSVFDNATGLTTYHTHKDVTLAIQVRAGNDESFTIANKLHKTFSFPSVLDALFANIAATITSISNPTPVPDVLSDRLEEFYTFNITFGIDDFIEDASSGYITTIDTVTGTYTAPAQLGGFWNDDGVWSDEGIWGA